MNAGDDTPSQTPHLHGESKEQTLRLVAWETTRNCNLACMHCRRILRRYMEIFGYIFIAVKFERSEKKMWKVRVQKCVRRMQSLSF